MGTLLELEDSLKSNSFTTKLPRQYNDNMVNRQKKQTQDNVKTRNKQNN